MPVRLRHLAVPTLLLALLVTVAAGAAPASATEVPPFEDTAGTSHEVAVQRLVAEGLIQGCDEDRFCSTDDLTRGQLASILARALGSDELGGGEDGGAPRLASTHTGTPVSFTDVEGSVHAEAIELLAQEGLVDGCEQGRFCPEQSVTRGQLATMLVAAFDLPPATGGESYFIDGGGTHGASIDALAANGISNGCGPVTFCTYETVQRSHAAVFLARALGLSDAVTFTSFEERLAEHERLERREQERREQERREAERRRELEERERLEAPGRAALEVAMAQIGKPYRWAGAGPHSFDCSGLVYYSWRTANGVTLPRSSRQMHQAVTPISRSELRPGDLVFYYSPVSHVAMYVGDGRVIDAPSYGGTVGIREDGLTRRGVVGFGRPGVSG
ncbi:MAG: NlpC/P60 family protein [Nitriliruptoraceae bacterium]